MGAVNWSVAVRSVVQGPKNLPFDNSFNNNFLLLQLETKNSFYKQCWPCMVSIKFLEKVFIKNLQY